MRVGWMESSWNGESDGVVTMRGSWFIHPWPWLARRERGWRTGALRGEVLDWGWKKLKTPKPDPVTSLRKVKQIKEAKSRYYNIIILLCTQLTIVGDYCRY
jgi:hypothetical protein